MGTLGTFDDVMTWPAAFDQIRRYRVPHNNVLSCCPILVASCSYWGISTTGIQDQILYDMLQSRTSIKSEHHLLEQGHLSVLSSLVSLYQGLAQVGG